MRRGSCAYFGGGPKLECYGTADGASVMLGKVNGVAAKLKLEVPHLVQQHCVAHREDLGISDTWKEIKLMRDIDTYMRTV